MRTSTPRLDAGAVILAGGLGTRLRDVVPDRPKPMVEVCGKPFVEWVIAYLATQGLCDICLSIGFMPEVIEEHLKARPRDGLDLSFVCEGTPQGTAGGFLLAVTKLHDKNSYLVANGDSLLLADLAPAFRLLEQDDTDAVISGVRVEDCSRYGSLDCADDGTLRGFREKREGKGVINGGLYLFHKKCLAEFSSQRPLSFEYDVFPGLLQTGMRVQVVQTTAPFIDIGTPESLKLADDFIDKNRSQFSLKPALFLDRDGVIIEEVNYLSDPSQLKLIPGAGEAIAEANRANIPVVVITNQSGVARGYFPESRIGEIHHELDALLARSKAHIDRYYYCPHHPTKGTGDYLVDCDCRKPNAGLLHQAAKELGLDLSRSFMIGDKLSDLEAGARAGCRSLLVLTGYGGTYTSKQINTSTYKITTDLKEGIRFCLSMLKA